jgi:hypothetical protein
MKLEHFEDPPNTTFSPSNSTSSSNLQMHYTKTNEEKTQISNAIRKRLIFKTSSSKSPPSPTNLTPKPQKHENTKTTKKKKSKLALVLTYLHVRLTTWIRDFIT